MNTILHALRHFRKTYHLEINLIYYTKFKIIFCRPDFNFKMSKFKDDIYNRYEAEEALKAVIEPEPVKPPTLGFQWTQDLFEKLQQEQQYVEKLWCIPDDYFFELLQAVWSDKHPDCSDGPEELRNVLDNFIQEQFDDNMEEEGNNGDTKETIKSEINPVDVVKTEVTPYECKEEPVETVELPRSKWVCDNHYIHVFYDDQDKNNECILTDQLLQIRNALVPMFPGQDLFKSGKKPSGFAKMLLNEWLRLYPGT